LVGGDEEDDVTATWRSSAWVEVSEEPGTLILRLAGELDMASVRVVESALMAAIPTTGAVVLDLGGLTFCDSTGIEMLAAAHRKASNEGTLLTVSNVPIAVARVLKISGMDQVLTITK
jgi:anti-sigma B factor antagonist